MLKTLTEIRNGFSIFQSEVFGQCKLRHPNLDDESFLDELQKENLEFAKKKGILTEKQLREKLNSEGLWTYKDEADIENINRSIRGARESLEKVIEQQRALLKKDIEDLENKKIEILSKKRRHWKSTAEDYSAKMTYEQYIPYLFDVPKFSKQDIDYFSDKQIDGVISVYGLMQSNLSEREIKKASLLPRFQNIFSLSDNVYDVFRKPLISLTVFQSRLLYFGKNYYNVICHLSGKVDPEMFSDPDALDKWAGGTEREKDILQRDWGQKAEAFSSKDAIAQAATKNKDRGEKLKAINDLL